jgi:UDP-glucose:(heptosyl)LPS alpha-1,3-glucosyltransferase
VAVSEPLREEIVTTFPDRAPDVRVIPNAVDLQRFRPDADARQQTREMLGFSDSDRVALFVGSEWQGKGLQLAVDALAQADGWHLIVVGSGDAETLVRRAAYRGVATRIHLVGEIDKPERYYATADAFVLPSAYETFSLAALEAAASGLPVVATGVGIVNSLATAGGAVLVERDPNSIAAALRRLGEEPEEAARIGERAHAFARGLDWGTAVEDYLSLYLELTTEQPVILHSVGELT